MKRAKIHEAAFVLALASTIAVACNDVPLDNERDDKRLFPVRGVIRGTVTYAGPPPCSRDGHIVGNALLFVFDRRNPPPPGGLAASSVNFVAVTGDVLFANEPRYVGQELYCPPADSIVETSAQFTIAPLDAGSYVIGAFYDRRGRFWPTFRFRNLPEAGDLAGGYVDVEDARRNASNPNYRPTYLPIDVGTRVGNPPPGEIPDFVLGEEGFVADNVPVVIGSVVPFTRPYFHPAGAEIIGDKKTSPANPSGDPLAVPIVAMRQDHRILALPKSPTPASLTEYQRRFQFVRLDWGVPSAEYDVAVDPALPFGLQLPQLPPFGKGGLLVFARGEPIPESALVPSLWPEVAFVKLVDAAFRGADPQSLIVQGTPQESAVTGKPPGPLVVLKGITLEGDSLLRTISGPIQQVPTTAALRDHVIVLIRPAALCIDARRVDKGGVLVTPHFVAPSADPSEAGDQPLFDPAALAKQRFVREVKRACLPMGRYAISAVYPTGQAWTVPNEMGGCATSEGPLVVASTFATCETKPRPVLLSQGGTAILEIVDAQDPATCERNPVPQECLPP